LVWSPGDSTRTTHPGDDEKAGLILDEAVDFLDPRPTATLTDLISVLKECKYMITPDGGAMHLAAAMGVSVVAMFGQSEPERWRPWSPRAKVLRSSSRNVNDISVEEVMEAWRAL
jgi:heptosyltransferase III